MHQVSLHWPQEVSRIVLAELVSLLKGVAVSGCEWQRVEVENW
jgi:hypothetical protein